MGGPYWKIFCRGLNIYRSIITKIFTGCIGTLNTFLNGDFFRALVAKCFRALSYALHELRGLSLAQAASLLLFLIYYNIFEPFSIRGVCFMEYPLTKENVDMILSTTK